MPFGEAAVTRSMLARAEPIVAAALDLDHAARAAWLERACDGDVALRQEVDSLLALEHASEHFLVRTALEDAALDAEPGEDPAALVGRQLGDYRVDAMIGAGGMADVYRVRNVPLARDEALKVLVPSPVVREGDRVQVEAEARAASRLNHPNIVTIFAVGEAAGLHFIAMELVEGETLRQRLAAGPVPVREVTGLAVQLADALAAAHAAGIVHRDLKPENIKITPEGRAKVLDFGIAGREHADTLAGSVAGTAGYMAPEQAAGEAARPASDQFSFGVVLQEMLTGQHPFARPSRGEMLAAVRTAEPAAISGLDPAGTALLRRCLAKQPGDRFPSTSALVAACREWQARVHARGMTRRRVLQTAGAAVALTAAGAGAWRYAAWSSRRRTVAVLPFRDLSDQAGVGYLADGLTATLIDRLSAMPSLALLPRSLVFNFRDAAAGAREVGRQLGAEVVLSGSVARRGERLTIEARLDDVESGGALWSSSYDRPSAELLLVEEDIARAIVDEGVRVQLNAEQRRRLLRRPTADPAAYELYLQAVYLCQQETEETYLEARDLLREALTRDPAFGAGHVQMATTFAVMAVDGLERPTDAWPESSRHVRRALAADPDLADAHASAAAQEFFFNWNWDGAEDEWRQAMRFGGAELHPDLYTSRALQRWALGRLDEALALVRQARRVDPVSPMFIIREADFLLQSGDAAAAAALYQQVLGAHPDDTRAHFGIAEAYRAQERFDDAVAARRLAHDAADEAEVVAGPAADTARAELARLDARSAQAQLAALDRRAQEGVYASPIDLARQHARLGRPDEAAALFEVAVADRAPGLAMLDVDRAWDKMRDDPRFTALRLRVGLPSSPSGDSR